ncbi:tetratricopeptide repeat protein [Sediminitomix flava]|uniref:Tetratricopeptide repeat protein n=1 Tax=Sediminitomix flava TaxID=379075 RepID=A0A315ZGJ4_SEDFL|nr:tetratricopeptide repeat protein [Sediminitomix flava]PWJ44706.1 hypothetical protein BC781_1011077 [Sediminitomix flava]
MNKYTSVLSSVLVAGSLMLTNCGVDVQKLADEQEFTIVPSPLELHGDSVLFTAKAKLPAKMLKPGYTYDLDLSYLPVNGESVELDRVSFKGDDYENQPETYQPEVSKDFGFAYQDSYKRGHVQYKAVITKDANGKSKETPLVDTPNGGAGIITTSRLVQPVFMPNYAPHGYITAEEYNPETVEFFFLQGSSALRWSEMNGEDGKKLKEYVKAYNPTRTVTLEGMHSPEGPTDVNTKLANQRPEAVKSYYEKLQNRYKAEEGEATPEFVVKPVVENWTEFKKLLVESDKFTDTEKDEILSIVNGAGDFVSKELKLQALGSYKKLFKYVYPPLRNSRAEILRIKDKLTPEEISARAQAIASGSESVESLSTPELLYAADVATSLEEKEAIYSAVIKKDADAAAYNNLGAVYLAMAKADASKTAEMLEKALPNFETAAKKQEMAEAYANIAGVKLMMGDVAGAKAAADKAATFNNPAVNQTVNAVKGYDAIVAGKYDEAIKALSSAGNDSGVLYNKALAYLLKSSKENSEDYSRAAATIKEAIAAQPTAYANYVAAVTAARQGKADDAVKFLADAVKADSSLKDAAKEDLEFRAMFEDAKFTEILN